MLKIGITGNIAAGKSLFESFLKAKGHRVLCLDFVTHYLYENNKDLHNFLLKKIGTFERGHVAKIAFSNPDFKKELEDFIYPLILEEMNKFFEEFKGEKLLFVSAALLFEAGFDKYFDKTVLISAPIELRLQRLMKRNGINEHDALLRINSQGSEPMKAGRADFVLQNTGSEAEFETKTAEFIKALNIL